MIKLVSVNIERSKHLELVLPFLLSQGADVVCIQELFERDISLFEEICGPCVVYGIEGRHPADPPEEGAFMEGTGIFTRLPIDSTTIHYYVGSEDHTRSRDAQRVPDDCCLVSCDVIRGEEVFRVITTHFTWSAKGLPTDDQRTDMEALIKKLTNSGEFILCGDFNAPRLMVDGTQGEIFEMLASKYKDNVPLEYKTSIDLGLHRAGHLPAEHMDKKMVDGLFSTPEYAVSDVKMLGGVSDHCAIVGFIEKRTPAS